MYVGVAVSQISSIGILQLSFNVSVFNPDLGVSQFNNLSLSIQMQKAYSVQTYHIPWTVVNITANQLYIFLNFSDPATVSMFS